MAIYTTKIENALARKRFFIVLDYIITLDQLDALHGSKGFHPGSKSIITTQDKWLTESCALFKANNRPKHERHLLVSLDEIQHYNLCVFMHSCATIPRKVMKRKSIGSCSFGQVSI
uniref:Uncharacterized protein n=1 Tax=Lactuca sativa TaxID=4236 RepID=A0A9R1WLI2_LACSA|nr:hypothetical protein LSAT_V11C100037640 [Lactuca sativa]